MIFLILTMREIERETLRVFTRSEISPKLTRTFSLIRPPPNGPTEFLYIVTVGIVLTQSIKDTSADTIALIIDHNIQVPARFTDRVTRRKVDKEKNPQAHVAPSSPAHPTFRLPDRRTHFHHGSGHHSRAARTRCTPHVDKGKGKSKTPEEREQERGRLRRWEHDNRFVVAFSVTPAMCR